LISGGYLIISGIIEQDISTIEKHFLHEPLVLHHILTEKEWICYILKKNRADGKA